MEIEISKRSMAIECPNCNEKLKVIVESKPKKVLIAHETINPEDIFLKFPTIGEPDSWPLTKSQVAHWIDIFKNVYIQEETRKALAWIEANPSKRKTARGMNRFLTAWLIRVQEKGQGKPKIDCETEEQKAKRKAEYLAIRHAYGLSDAS